MKTAKNIASIDLTADIIDTRDIIERFEQLETEMPDNDNEVRNWTDLEEYSDLQEILRDIKGLGGDEQWRGDWYPLTLIRESYFTAYTKDLLEDCGTIPRDFPAWIAIDWERTAAALQSDYTDVDIIGVTYFTR